jgi:hypothetical protein
MDHAHTSEIRPMAEPLQLLLFPDQAALTCHFVHYLA